MAEHEETNGIDTANKNLQSKCTGAHVHIIFMWRTIGTKCLKELQLPYKVSNLTFSQLLSSVTLTWEGEVCVISL